MIDEIDQACPEEGTLLAQATNQVLNNGENENAPRR
jgi:hypothetical protein